jgi:MFS family permease
LILILFLLSPWASRLVSRYGAKLPLTVGPVIAALGYALFAVPGIGGGYWTTFFPAVVVLGLGMAVSVAPLSAAVMGAVEHRHAGIASGINNAMSRTAALLAIAVMGVVVLSAFNQNLDARLATLDVPAWAVEALDSERIKLAGAEMPTGLNQEASAVMKRAVDEAFLAGSGGWPRAGKRDRGLLHDRRKKKVEHRPLARVRTNVVPGSFLLHEDSAP